jgi:hypothetical protein
MKRRSVRHCCIYVLAAFGCQGKSEPPPAPALPESVVVRDNKGETLVEMRPGHPCRAAIGPFEMMVGGPPLVAQLGEAHWVGDDEKNGTTISRNGKPVARVFPVGDPMTASVIDPQGIALVHVQKGGGDVVVSNAAGQTVRHLHTRVDGAIVIDQPAATATGTKDLVLVALLTAAELPPEVRMIAACQRVLVKGP